MRKLMLVLVVAGGFLFAVSTAQAVCPVTTPLLDTSGVGMACPDTARVNTYVFALTSAGVNSGTAKVECEADGFPDPFLAPTDPPHDCPSGVGGVAGDGVVGIASDWANPGFNGCITDLAAPQRVVLVAQAADGTGFIASSAMVDPSGSGFDRNFLLAHSLTPDFSAILPFTCSSNGGRPTILNLTNNATSVTLQLHFDAPAVYSDCDALAYGSFFGSCSDGFVANPAVGHIYTSNQACDAVPRTDFGSQLWTPNVVTPDASGDATLTLDKPASGCLYVGGSTMVGGSETPAVTGFVQVSSDLAASPHALDVRAEQAGGKVVVRFRTDTELGLAKINILTTDKQGTRTVAGASPRGVGGGGASYEVSIDRSQIKGGKTIEVELVGVGGTRLFKSAPVGY
ncbi:MAG TPA: hypothetical protein VNH46_05530 [Gemmatimonadales bacterium]|nr:hypothetical protein [Gemmatimonadales bacterium]